MNTEQNVTVNLPFNTLRDRVSAVLGDFIGTQNIKEAKLNIATSRLLGFDNFKALESMLSNDDELSEVAHPIYLTNSALFECGHFDERTFKMMGLSYSKDEEGNFYPLTEKEKAFVREEYPDTAFTGTDIEFGYSVLYRGVKCASPIIDTLHNKNIDSKNFTPEPVAKARNEEIYAAIAPTIAALGGKAFNNGDVGHRYQIDVVVPFSIIRARFGSYEKWRDWLVALINDHAATRLGAFEKWRDFLVAPESDNVEE